MQKIVFVTGKGGVGKSVYAASLAHKYASSGQKTLLVELGDESFFKTFFNLSEVTYTGTKTKQDWDVALWSGADCLKEYALHLLRSEAIYKLFFENKVSRSLIQIAPGLPELSILGKITSGPRHHGPASPHQVIIVDAYSTGHFLALMRAPKGMSEAIRFGPMGEQSRSIIKTIMDPTICEYHIVTLAEELPVKESLELYSQLDEEFSVQAKVILNKKLNTTLESTDLSPKTNVFVKYIQATLAREEDARNRVESRSLKMSYLPFLFGKASYDLISNLSNEIKI